MNYMNFDAKSPTSVHHSPVIHRRMRNTRQMWLLVLVLALSFSLFGQNAIAQSASAGKGKLHTIGLWAEKIPAGAEGGNDRFAYRMNSHVISDLNGNNETDVTSRYAAEPTIPGPTIVINEGDEVALTLSHVFDPDDSTTLDQVSVHVHGVHYDILSDGTIKYINLVEDESATPVATYTYHWIAAPGTAGTWAYHDHNMITLNGAEDRGLYGALIVNSSASLDSIAKDYVLFIGDDAFFGMEIDSETGQQVSLGDNPTLTAQQGSNVRFHLVALGTVTHNFALPGYSWTDPGTNLAIENKIVGPLEKHVFTVLADSNSQYMDTVFSSSLLGMKGDFNVIP